ncbi:hypothetical protein RNJ44_00856 [Nakaseomyces bracarensis]|uniref:PA14 domain-containing protein n=1 Tax=Nakaseomyces bracarensis TaxID=273131 RepID=A0ABR4NQB5_9SACH
MVTRQLFFWIYILFLKTSLVSGYIYRDVFINGCSGSVNPKSKGLTMELYEYPYLNPIVECPDGTLDCREYDTNDLGTAACVNDNFKYANYPRYGFKEQKLIAKVEGVASKPGEGGTLDFDIDSSMSCVPQLSTLPIAYNYKEEFHTTNFSMLLHGYFKPLESGDYSFYVEGSTEVLVSIGHGIAFNCCSYDETANDFKYVAIYSNDDLPPHSSFHAHRFYLEKGVYYPIRIFYLNADKRARFEFSFRKGGADGISDGIKIEDLSPYFFSFVDEAEGCLNTI